MRSLGTRFYILWAFHLVFVYSCDPLTQYQKDDECCDKCGPGTRMSSLDHCRDPVCVQCKGNEYQPSYTKEKLCKLQPYCDQNQNFEPGTESRKSYRPCICMSGYHCSSKECLTCVSHSACSPGHGVFRKGNHTGDTVCYECSSGTFSSENSLENPCQLWKSCGSGSITQEGTRTTDRVCAEKQNLVAILIPVLVLLVVFVAFFIILKFKGRGQFRKLQEWFLSSVLCKKKPECGGNQQELAEENTPVGTEREIYENQPHAVENEDQSLIQTAGLVEDRTFEGRLLTQEQGKTEHAPQPESQPY